jgi:hypothetical protein
MDMETHNLLHVSGNNNGRLKKKAIEMAMT